MSLNDIIFGVAFTIMTLITLGGGIAAVSVRNIFHAALFLVMTFFGVAGIYLLLEAEFLAIVQILIYVGAISVLLLFAIMLTQGLMRKDQPSTNSQWGWALIMVLSLFGAIFLLAFQFPWPTAKAVVKGDMMANIGASLLTTYLLPFEVVSLLLLAALLGAFVIARE